MSQTNTDYLFQAIAPVADRASSAARNGDDAPEFGDHLTQASASAFDVVRPPSRSDTSSVNSTSGNRPTNSSYERDASGPSAKPADSTSTHADRSSASSQSSSQEQPVKQVGDTSAATEQEDNKQHDVDKPDDDDAAAVAAAAIAAGTNAPQMTLTVMHKADGDAAKPVKSNGSSDDAAQRAAKRAAKAEEPSTKSNPQAKVEDAKLVATAEAEAKTGEAPADGADAAKPTAEGAAASKQVKRDEYNAHVATSHAATRADDSALGNNQTSKRATTEDNAPQTVDTSEKATTKVQTNAKAITATAPKSTSDSDESSDDEPPRGSKTTARANSRSDAVASASKSGVAAVANGVSANVLDAATATDSTNDSKEAAAKPVAAKANTAALSPGHTTRPTSEANRGGRAANVNETPRVDPARFVGRVAKAFQTANERGGKLQLRLSPPELGSIRLELTVKDGVMSAAVETDNANARHVLLEHLPALRDRLAEQNIRVDRFDVDVRHENSGGQANPRGPQQQSQQQQPENNGSRRTLAERPRVQETVQPEVSSATPRITNTGINLVV